MPRWERQDGHAIESDVSILTTDRDVVTGPGKYYGVTMTATFAAGQAMLIRDGAGGTILHSIATGTNPTPNRVPGGHFVRFTNGLHVDWTSAPTTPRYTVFFERGNK